MSVQFTYDTPVREMIALGKYNNGGFESDLLRYKMPVELQGEVAMPHLYHPGKAIWPDALDEQGLRSANLAELLWFGYNNREEQMKHSIVSLCHSRSDIGGTRLPLLGHELFKLQRDGGAERKDRILTTCVRMFWHESWRVAVVSK